MLCSDGKLWDLGTLKAVQFQDLSLFVSNLPLSPSISIAASYLSEVTKFGGVFCIYKVATLLEGGGVDASRLKSSKPSLTVILFKTKNKKKAGKI